MEFSRGEIFFDPCFCYDEGKGETCDKHLLLLNKNHTHLQDVVYVPAKTNTAHFPFQHGCNEEHRAFYFAKDGSFYKGGTVIQLEHIRLTDGEWFEEMIQKKGIKRENKKLSQEEFGQILNCLKRIKFDISYDIQELIF